MTERSLQRRDNCKTVGMIHPHPSYSSPRKCGSIPQWNRRRGAAEYTHSLTYTLHYGHQLRVPDLMDQRGVLNIMHAHTHLCTCSVPVSECSPIIEKNGDRTSPIDRRGGHKSHSDYKSHGRYISVGRTDLSRGSVRSSIRLSRSGSGSSRRRGSSRKVRIRVDEGY